MTAYTEYGYGDPQTWGGCMPFTESNDQDEIENEILSDQNLLIECIYEYIETKGLESLEGDEKNKIEETLLEMDDLISKAIDHFTKKELKNREELRREAIIDAAYY